MAVDKDGTTYEVYQDNANNDKATVMKYNGTNWGILGATGFSPDDALGLSIAIGKNGNPYVVYSDAEGKAKVMKFEGNTWQTVGAPEFLEAYAFSPSIAIDRNGKPFVAFADGGNDDRATVITIEEDKEIISVDSY